MFRASPWISYEPQSQYTHSADSVASDAPHDPAHEPEPHSYMDAPEISTLREEEEETPPPDAGRLSFSKFRVNLRMSARGGTSSPSASAAPPSSTTHPSTHRRPSSPPDSDDEDEEDQLIDDDELAIVTETGRAPVSSSPVSHALLGSPASTPTPRKRGSATRGRQRRGGLTGRRGRPGREPPDAAAMMSTFELTKTDQPGPTSTPAGSPPLVMPVAAPPPQVPGPSTADWSSSAPPKPPRKKPGPKKGSTLGPRGPRKNATKTSQLTSGRGTPVLDDSLLASDAPFLIPMPPSIPPTPGLEQPPLPSQLPPITAPDFTRDPTIPVPVYPLPTRSFAVQPPPKIPAGYATAHPLDLRGAPPRKWKLAQREIKGIAGGRWFARSWVGEKDKDAPGPPVLRHAPPSLQSPPTLSAHLPDEPRPSQRLRLMDTGPSVTPAGSDDANLMKSSDPAPPAPSHKDSSPEPEPESPRSPAGSIGTSEPGEGPRIPS